MVLVLLHVEDKKYRKKINMAFWLTISKAILPIKVWSYVDGDYTLAKEMSVDKNNPICKMSKLFRTNDDFFLAYSTFTGIRIYQTSTGTLVHSFDNTKGFAFHPSTNQFCIFLGEQYKTTELQFWEVGGLTPLFTKTVENLGYINEVKFNRDGSLLVAVLESDNDTPIFLMAIANFETFLPPLENVYPAQVEFGVGNNLVFADENFVYELLLNGSLGQQFQLRDNSAFTKNPISLQTFTSLDFTYLAIMNTQGIDIILNPFSINDVPYVKIAGYFNKRPKSGFSVRAQSK